MSLRLGDSCQALTLIAQGCPAPDIGALCDASCFAQRLFFALEERQQLIERLLQGVGASFGLQALLGSLQAIAKQMQTNPSHPVAVAADLGARTLFDMMNLLECQSLFPQPLVPPPRPAWL